MASTSWLTSLPGQILRNAARTERRVQPSRRIPYRFQPVGPLLPVSHNIVAARQYATSGSEPQPPDYLSEGELQVFNKLKTELQPERLEVQDISGGCGSMYAMDIVSPKFAGLTVIKQHKLVNQILAEEIKGWHGVQLKTKAS